MANKQQAYNGWITINPKVRSESPLSKARASRLSGSWHTWPITWTGGMN
jgi:hypothetical protein